MTHELKPAEISAAERWYLGSMNDGLFIINTPPRPSNDDVWHDRPDGPSMVLNVTSLTRQEAQSVVDAHNAYISAAKSEPVAVKALEWRHYPDAFPPMWVSQNAPFGNYSIEEAAGSDCPSYDVLNPTMGVMVNCEGLPEAKAAAQADCESRIRSALASEPANG